MVNQTLIWLLVLPFVFGATLWYFNRDKGQDGLIFSGGYIAIALVVFVAIFFASKSGATADTEIWNGKVTSKERVHGEYEQPYQCYCVTISDGKGGSTTTCQTCYETHYTVHWNCATTVGPYTIDSVDSTWKSKAYETPNPARWTSIQVGDPVAREQSYVNYIQAVPNSLFTPSSKDLKAKFASLIPAYPDKVHDIYNINRVLTPGFLMPDVAQWNRDVSMMLRDLGPTKQVNAVLVIVKTDDPNYEYALRDAWQGANKNDVVIIIGTTDFPNISWVRVISWTKNELFKVELRDSLMDMSVINRSMISTIGDQIGKNFERRRMREFEYLSAEIDPPNWIVTMMIILAVIGAAGAHVFLLQKYRHRRNNPSVWSSLKTMRRS